MKITGKIIKEFTYLEIVGREQDFIEHAYKTPLDIEGVTALEAWAKITTYGEYVACSEPALLDSVRSGKVLINLTIEMWSEDLVGGLMTRECLEEVTRDAPKWVYNAAIKQSHKLALSEIGFIPTYLKQS